MPREKVQLRRYLLGDLPEEEMEGFDQWVISDDDSGYELEAAEDELIEDYLDGSVSERDRALFHENFLVSDERQANLELIRMLKQQSASPAREIEKESVKPLSFLERLLRGYRPLAAAAAVVMVTIAGYFAWQIVFSKRPTALEQEYALLNRSELTIDGSTDARSIVQLSPGQLRGSEKPVEVIADSLSDAVLFRLFLAYQKEPQVTFRLEVVQGDVIKFTVENVRVYTTNAGSELRVLVPKAVLARGAAELKISENLNPEMSQTYNLVIR